MIDSFEKAEAFAPILDRLSKLLPRLASDQPGEVMATAAAISRTLAGAKLDWHDLTARLTAETLDDMIADAAKRPWPPEPAPQPTPPTARWSAEREAEFQAAQKPKRQPSPWPTWSKLSHQERLHWLQEVDAYHELMSKSMKTAFYALHQKLFRRPHEIVSSDEVALFNRTVKAAWQRLQDLEKAA